MAGVERNLVKKRSAKAKKCTKVELAVIELISFKKEVYAWVSKEKILIVPCKAEDAAYALLNQILAVT